MKAPRFRTPRHHTNHYAQVSFALRRDTLARLLAVLERDGNPHGYAFDIIFGSFLELAIEDRIEATHQRLDRRDEAFRRRAHRWFHGPRRGAA